jgi:hypothetical protein
MLFAYLNDQYSLLSNASLLMQQGKFEHTS